MELQLSGSVSLLERLEEFATEHFAENPFWEKETRIARADPACVIPRQAAGGNHTVNMGMMLEFLIPGMEDTEEADLGTKMFGIGGNLDQGLAAATE